MRDIELLGQHNLTRFRKQQIFQFILSYHVFPVMETSKGRFSDFFAQIFILNHRQLLRNPLPNRKLEVQDGAGRSEKQTRLGKIALEALALQHDMFLCLGSWFS